MRRLDTTKLFHSNVVEAMLKILAEKGYIESYNVVEEDKKKMMLQGLSELQDFANMLSYPKKDFNEDNM